MIKRPSRGGRFPAPQVARCRYLEVRKRGSHLNCTLMCLAVDYCYGINAIAPGGLRMCRKKSASPKKIGDATSGM